MKRYMILLLIGVFVVSMLFIGAGCKQSTSTETTAVKTTATETTAVKTTATETTAAKATAKVEYKIAVYFPAPHPYFESVKKGIAKFTTDTGIKVFIQLGTDWTQDTENTVVEALAAQGYNALFIAGMDASGANALIKELVAKGIFCINYATSVAKPTDASFNLATDVKAAAMIATEKVIKTMGEKGGLLDILESVQDPNTILRKQGVEEVVAKYPNVKIVQTIGDMLDVQVAVEKISGALAALGDQVNGMVTTGYNPTVAAAQILSERKNKTIAYVGIDDDPVVIKAIEEGYITGTFDQNPYMQGYLSPYLLKLLLDGHTLKEKGTFIDTSGLIITKDNATGFLDGLWKATFDARDKALDTWFNK
ncbi:MAG: sugar ABC transporter substrate-binding protein [Candidatus Humimicrobiaceae bacterium]